jgi:hypothetical protein
MNEKPHMNRMRGEFKEDGSIALPNQIVPPASLGTIPRFGCGRIVNWKTDKPKRIFREWRQLSDATIAAPSTNAPKKSSWYRTPVTHPVKSAGLG